MKRGKYGNLFTYKFPQSFLELSTHQKIITPSENSENAVSNIASARHSPADAVKIVEESAQRISDILGIPIHNGDFLNFSPDKTYPIIIMGDVIEHVTDPEAALKRCSINAALPFANIR